LVAQHDGPRRGKHLEGDFFGGELGRRRLLDRCLDPRIESRRRPGVRCHRYREGARLCHRVALLHTHRPDGGVPSTQGAERELPGGQPGGLAGDHGDAGAIAPVDQLEADQVGIEDLERRRAARLDGDGEQDLVTDQHLVTVDPSRHAELLQRQQHGEQQRYHSFLPRVSRTCWRRRFWR
jgi:hypothetical protein